MFRSRKVVLPERRVSAALSPGLPARARAVVQEAIAVRSQQAFRQAAARISSIICKIVFCCSSSFRSCSRITLFSARISRLRSPGWWAGLRSLCAYGTREQPRTSKLPRLKIYLTLAALAHDGSSSGRLKCNGVRCGRLLERSPGVEASTSATGASVALNEIAMRGVWPA